MDYTGGTCEYFAVSKKGLQAQWGSCIFDTSRFLIAEVEKQLGVSFPASYKTFLEEGSEYGLHFEEFLWIGTERDLVVINLEERLATLPDFLVSFLSDGYGTQICFDTRKMTANLEYPIVEWERGMQKEDLIDSELETVAPDFPSWLITRLEEEQEDLEDV